MKKDSFVFFKSFFDAIQNIPKENQLEVYEALCTYSFTGEVPEIEGISKAMFILMKPNIDKSNARYEASVNNGKKGGRPKKEETKQKPSQNLTETKQKPSQNHDVDVDVDVDDNDDENVNDTVNDKYYDEENKVTYTEVFKEIIDYLNDVCQTRYRHTSKSTQRHIRARLNEGYSVCDFFTVIDKKAKEWKNTKMEKYLRPETLFIESKFENYLNQKTDSDRTVDPDDPLAGLGDSEWARKWREA